MFEQNGNPVIGLVRHNPTKNYSTSGLIAPELFTNATGNRLSNVTKEKGCAEASAMWERAGSC
jgi:hypothetical protein